MTEPDPQGKARHNLRGFGSQEHKELRERLRRKGEARGGGKSRAEEVGRGGGGP